MNEMGLDYEAKKTHKTKIIREAFGVQDVSKKVRKQFERAVARYKLQVGVDGEEVKLMHNVEIAKGVSKYVEVLHDGTLPDALWDLHTAAAVGIASCHSPMIMENAAKGRYCGINQEMCRAMAKCCTLCNLDVYKKAKKVRMHTKFSVG